MLFDISTIAITAGSVTGLGAEIDKFEGRLKHLVDKGMLKPTARESDHPKAARLFNREEACLGAVLIVATEIWGFGSRLQQSIVNAVQQSTPSANPLPGPEPTFDLAKAVYGVANGEKWALILSWRGIHDIQARFVPFSEAQPNEGTEELLSAIGRPLFGRLIINVTDLFEPFATYGRA